MLILERKPLQKPCQSLQFFILHLSHLGKAWHVIHKGHKLYSFLRGCLIGTAPVFILPGVNLFVHIYLKR